MKGLVTGNGFFGLRRRERERERGHGGERSLGGAAAERSLGGAAALSDLLRRTERRQERRTGSV